MTTEHDMAVAMATEIGKQVPVKQAYEDAASPAARQVGATLEDVVKCIRLVGFPIQWLAVQQDRFRAFIEKAKEAVPEENRVLPAPEVLGPVLEAIKYNTSETPISEAFRRLLSRAMDSSRVHEAHPAFINIIARLSSDEAYLLVEIRRGNTRSFQARIEDGSIANTSTELLPYELDNKKFFLLYINNLMSCGLVKMVEQPTMVARSVRHGQEIARTAYSYVTFRLTPFGEAFVKACLDET